MLTYLKLNMTMLVNESAIIKSDTCLQWQVIQHHKVALCVVRGCWFGNSKRKSRSNIPKGFPYEGLYKTTAQKM